MDVAQGGIGGTLPAAPGGTRAGAGGFIPDDFPAHQVADVHHHLGDKAS